MSLRQLAGSTCADAPGFTDTFGYNCTAYRTEGWCANGEVGPAWQAAWGGLPNATRGACCACGKHTAADRRLFGTAQGGTSGAWHVCAG